MKKNTGAQKQSKYTQDNSLQRDYKKGLVINHNPNSGNMD